MDRFETIQLNQCLDRMLEDIQSNENYGPSTRMEENRKAHDIVSKELARQVSVHCMDQGLLTERCLTFYSTQVQKLPELFLKPMEEKMSLMREKIEEQEMKYEALDKKYNNLDKRYKETRNAEAAERKQKAVAESKQFEAEQALEVMDDRRQKVQRDLEKMEQNYQK